MKFRSALRALHRPPAAAPGRRPRKAFFRKQFSFDNLEQRLVLAATPEHVLATGHGPFAVQIEFIDDDPWADLVAASSDGRATVAINDGADRWSSITTTHLGLAPLYGMLAGRFGLKSAADLVLQGPDSIVLASGNGAGRFAISATLATASPGTFTPTIGNRVGLVATLWNGDLARDLIALSPGTNELLIIAGRIDGSFETPVRYATGAVGPIDLATGQFVGDVLPDVAIAHADGNVTILEGRPGGALLLRPELTVPGLSAVTGLAAADFNSDGGTDLAVARTDSITILANIDEVLTTSPLSNGDFSLELLGWQTAELAMGQTPNVTAAAGFAQLTEAPHQLLASLWQTFLVPPAPQSISFDLVALNLEAPDGAIPDAFEASLLDRSLQSLVPTTGPETTSFWNAGPGGVTLGARTAWNGRRATLDISQLEPGTVATLYFDLLCLEPGLGSNAAIDNVRIHPETIYVDAVQSSSVPGPFSDVSAIAHGDVNADGRVDLVVADRGVGVLLYLEGDGNGGFTRRAIPIAGFGSGALAIAAGPIAERDATDDVAVTLFESNLVLSPLSTPGPIDSVPPTVSLIDPAPDRFHRSDPARVRIRFSESVRDTGPAGLHSVTNPAAYRLFSDGENNTFEAGAGDDVPVPIAAVIYDSSSFEATLEIDPGATPLRDDKYTLMVHGDRTAFALEDWAGNRLSGGDSEFQFVVDTAPPQMTVSLSPSILWPPNRRMATIKARITTGDLLDSNPTVVLLAVTSSEPNGQHLDEPDPDAGDRFRARIPPDIDGAIIGTDDLRFRVRRERHDRITGRVYTAHYYVYDDACNGQVVSQVVVVPPNRNDGARMLDAIGDPTPIGLGNLVTCQPGALHDPPIEINQTVADSIGTPGEVDLWTFQAAANQRLFFQAGDGSGFSFYFHPHWTLTGPDGMALFSHNFATHDTIAMPQMGQYTLTISAQPGEIGSYSFKVWDVPPITPLPIGLSQPINGSLDVPGEQDHFTFAASAGQQIFFDVQTNGGLFNHRHFEIIAPDGSSLFGRTGGDRDVVTLTQSGTHTVVVDGGTSLDDTGPYGFQIVPVPPPVTAPIEIGQVVSGTISVPGEEDHFTFLGKSGDRLLFDVQIGGAELFNRRAFAIRRPNGTALFNASSDDRDVFTLAESGTYTVIVGDGSTIDNTGPYQFQIWAVPQPIVTPMQLGEVVGGEIARPGEEDHYTFTGTAGEVVFFDDQSNNPSPFFFRHYSVRRPGGSVLVPFTRSDFGPVVLPESGTYTIVWDSNAIDGTGPYQAQLWRVPADPRQAIRFDSVLSGAIDVPGQTIRYTLDAPFGIAGTFDVLWNKSDVAGFTLRNPSGTAVFTGRTGDVSVTAAAGTYSLLVDEAPGRAADSTATFSFRFVSDPAAALPPASDLTVTSVAAPVRAIGDPATLELTWTVTNSGTEATDVSRWIDRVRVSSDGLLGGVEDWRIAEFEHTGMLAAGASYTRTEQVVLPPGFEGDVQFFVETDAANHVFEGQFETNGSRPADRRTAVFRSEMPQTGEPAIALDVADGSPFPADSIVAFSGRAQPLPGSVNILYVVDVSSSTADVTGLDANFDDLLNAQDDLNRDGRIGDILDAEIGAMLFLNQRLAVDGTPVRAAVVAFSSAAQPLDLGAPFFEQRFTSPSADADHDGIADFEEAARSMFSSLFATGAALFRPFSIPSATNFQAAIQAAAEIIDRSLDADSTKVFFLTDGAATTEPTEPEIRMLAAHAVDFQAFQLTGTSITPSLLRLASLMDAEPHSSGSATLVADPNDLADALSGSLEITRVAINGTPVERLDPSGHFFSRVPVAAGNNAFTVSAVDSNGRISSQAVTLVGTTAGTTLDFQALRDVTGVAALQYHGTTFHRRARTLFAHASILNTGVDPLDGPVLAAIEQITPPSITLRSWDSAAAAHAGSRDGVDPAGRPYFCFVAAVTPQCPAGLHGEIAPTGLEPGTASRPRLVGFVAPPDIAAPRFSANLSLFALGNTAPFFSSVPPGDAAPNTPYSYATRAIDPDGTPLEFLLTAAPAAMEIGRSSGIINWTPAAAQIGSHSVLIEAIDGRGGRAIQSFHVTVATPSVNRPPLIFSRPPAVATPDELYLYNVAAFDSDNDPIQFELDRTTTPAGMTIDATGRIEWRPNARQVGTHPIIVRALDPCAAQSIAGCNAGAGEQAFVIDVRPTNAAPEFTSEPLTSVRAGELYRYNANATDHCSAASTCDSIRFSLVGDTMEPPAAMTIDPRSGLVLWPTTAGDTGEHEIIVRASDDRGAHADQRFPIRVLPDREPPVVSVLLSGTVSNPGDAVTIQVVAHDNVSVADRSLEINGVLHALDANHSAVYTATTPGRPRIVASARDTSGNSGTSCTTPTDATSEHACYPLRVVDPSDNAAPQITITSPPPGAMITYLTEIIGAVADSNLEFYRLGYAPLGSGQFVPFHEISCFATADPCPLGPVLGTLDPTLMPNDDYLIRVTAGDFSGNQATLEFPISISAHAKLGNFRIEFTDLSVPVAGIPLEIRRVYDTLDAGHAGDFGFGWRLAVAQARIRESVRVSPLEAAGVPDIFGAFPFRAGTRVYLNNPAGRRVGFTFDPVPEPGLTGTIWRPRFEPDRGVFDRLEVEPVALQQRSDGTFQLFAFFGAQSFPYNPRTYQLITKDGITYRYDQFNDLQQISDRNSNTLTYSPDGIVASSGQSIRFIRDAVGRITQIIDPAGNGTNYEYDARGDLVSVTDRLGNVTGIEYRTDPAHYLEQIVDPLGHSAIRTEYGDDGRVVATSDALGNTSTQRYELDNFTEIVADRLGNETRLRFDQRGNVIQVTDPLGGTTHFSYDADDNPIATTDPRGFTTTRSFDERGNITSIMDAAANTWSFNYTPGNDLSSATDPLGRTVQYRHDSNGNLVELVDAAGARSIISYDLSGRITAYTDPNGRTTQFDYGTGTLPGTVTNPDGSTRSIEYNAIGRPTRLVDENGNASVLEYDAAGRPVAVRDAMGNTTSFSYQAHRLVGVTDPIGRTRRYVYDAADRRVQEIDPLGGITQFTFDANNRRIVETDPLGRATHFAYRPDGRLQEIVDPMGGTTRYDYDEAGNQIRVTDANGHTAISAYDPLNRLIARQDALGGTRRFEYDAVGNLVRLIDENGHATQFAYDRLDRLVQRTDPLGGTEQVGYDAAGNQTSYIDALGRTTRFRYDAMDRLAERTDPAGGTERYAYDAVGNRVAVSDALGHTTRFQFDSLNRHVATTDPLGGSVTFEHDAAGNRIAEIDALGHTTRYTFDALDRLISLADPLGAVTQLNYDAAGNRTALTDPLGNTTLYAYDALDRLVTETNPLGDARSYAYDAAGNLVESIDRLGRVRRFDYDPLDRRVREVWLEAGSPVESIEFAYDPAGNLLRAVDSNSSFTFTYDALGRTASVDNAGTPGIPHVVLHYTYDPVGNLLSVVDSAGTRADSLYDPVDRLIGRTWSGPDIDPARVEYSYDARGDRTETRRYGARDAAELVGRSTLRHDAAGRLIDLVHRDAVDAVLAQTAYAYDSAGRLTSEIRRNQTVHYSYDPASQLVAADYSASPGSGAIGGVQPDEFYAYDLNGNRAAAGVVVGANNRVLADATFDYAYDAEGNLVRRTDRASGVAYRFAYDHRNRLTRVEVHDDAGSVTDQVDFAYDALDRRMAKSTMVSAGAGAAGGGSTVTVYDGPHAWADFDDSGTVDVRYLVGSEFDELVARYRTPTGPNAPSDGTGWYLSDRLGTIRDVASATGATVNHVEYDSFGGVVDETGAAAGDRFRFTGREFDAETALYFYRSRYYDPGHGRFTTEDPLGYGAGDANFYRYVGNRPLDATDPSGLLTITEQQVLIGAGVGTATGAVLSVMCGVLDNAAAGNPPLSIREIGNLAIQGGLYGFLLGASLGLVAGYAPAALGSVTNVGLVSGFGSMAVSVSSSETGAQLAVRGVCGAASVFLPHAIKQLGRLNITNPLPLNGRFARVMPFKFAKLFVEGKGKLGSPNSSEVFVTAAEDLAGITTKNQAQTTLSLFRDKAATLPNTDGDVVLTFDVNKQGNPNFSTPIETPDGRGAGFVGGGRTGGNAREYVLGNGTAAEIGATNLALTLLN